MAIINEATGQMLCSNAHFSNEWIIDLSHSDIQDRVFGFYAPPLQGDSSNGWFRSMDYRLGVMVLSVHNIYRKNRRNIIMISKYIFFMILVFISNNVLAAACLNPGTECVEGIKCNTTSDGTVVVQDENYSFPVVQCSEAEDINCDRDLFFVGSDCASTNPEKNSNFYKAVISHTVLNVAAEEVKKQNIDSPQIFTGKSMECSKSIALAKDCCGIISSSGWTEGAFLNCADDEKELAKAKEAGRVVEAGNGNNEYCYNEVLGVCTSYHKVYCVFDSKMARIVQHDGRKNQLGISFGMVGDDSAQPNCRGITPEELSRMKFDRMDFSELYAEIAEKSRGQSTNK